MKNASILILIFSVSTFAAGPTGDLSKWKGRYETTKCTQCPNHVVNSGANLKNFTSFAFGYGTIDPKNILVCAQTNIWIGMDFTIESDDRKITQSVGHTSGQCDWNYQDGESLSATAETLIYQSNNPARKMSLTLKKIGTNAYLFHQTGHEDSPSWGYPTDWEYQVEMKMVDPNP